MKAARQRWFLLGAALLSAIAGLCILLWSWPSDESRDRAVQGMYGVGNPLFSDPAFSPHASIGDIIGRGFGQAVLEALSGQADRGDARVDPRGRHPHRPGGTAPAAGAAHTRGRGAVPGGVAHTRGARG